MTERIGISLILLVIAVAHLMTDVVRLALEVSPRPGINHPGPVPMRSGQQQMPRPPPGQEEPEQQSGAAAESVFDHPRVMPANAIIHRLPPDFSINQPPWCRACRHRDPPHERSRRDEWQARSPRNLGATEDQSCGRTHRRLRIDRPIREAGAEIMLTEKRGARMHRSRRPGRTVNDPLSSPPEFGC